MYRPCSNCPSTMYMSEETHSFNSVEIEEYLYINIITIFHIIGLKCVKVHSGTHNQYYPFAA